MRRAADPFITSDDTRQQIFPFFRYMDPSLFPNDYIGDFYLNAFLPVGYQLSYRTAAQVWDPTALSTTLPYVLLAALLVAVGATAHRLGGVVAALLSMALCLTGTSYLHSVSGGLPRGFGMPVLAGGLAALVYGRPVWAMVAVWVGAAFYPVAGFLLGMTTTAVWLFLPRDDRGSACEWTTARTFAMLAVTLGVSAALLAPTAIGSREYGRFLSSADVELYPEVGLGGRYEVENVAPWPGYLTHGAQVAREAILGHGAPWTPLRDRLSQLFWCALVALTAVGWVRSLRTHPSARVVTALAVVAVVGHFLARHLAPFLFLPSRYVMYPVPVLTALMVPAGLVSLGNWAASAFGHPRVGPAAGGVACVVLLLLVGGHGDPTTGLTRDASKSASLFAAVERLPPDVLIAGFPRGPINDIPLFAKRQVLLGYETHQVFHEGYLLEMRRRLRALLDGYYATSLEPLHRLRDEFGVTHVLVDRRHFYRGPPRYFRPFGSWVADAHDRAKGRAVLLSPQARAAEVYRDRWTTLIDLNVLLSPADQLGQGSR